MNIVFVINNLKTEGPQSTALMMWKAHQRGHKVYAAGVDGFSFMHKLDLGLHCVHLKTKKDIDNAADFIKAMKEKGESKKLRSSDIDVLMLRNNPTEESKGRNWAEHAGVAFGRMMQNEGVLVLNDAYALSYAFIDKLYFEELPQEIKPKSIITRNEDELINFYEENNQNVVLKPLEGSGGQNIYRIDKHEKNRNQIIDNLMKGGYIIAQEYLPEVSKGDVRVLLLNGRVLTENSKPAVIRRVAGEGEFRSNFALGASADSASLTDAMKRIIQVTAPKIIKDGLFMVGLDIVQDKLIEINVLSPGGLEYFPGVDLPDFSTTIIESIERKLEYKKHFGNEISNRQIATME